MTQPACASGCWRAAAPPNHSRCCRWRWTRTSTTDVIRGVLRRLPACDIVRVQDVGLRGADDRTVLAWAAHEGRVLLTHDVATLINDAYTRVRAGEAMPGLFVVGHDAPIGQVIDDLLLLVECSLEGEWEGRILYLPIRAAP